MTEEVEVYKKAFDIACSNRVLSFNDPAINTLFKAVKKALGNDFISRIEHLDSNKAIMIVCGDDNLTKGIVDYVWYTHPPKLVSGETGFKAYRESLRHRDYLGWTEGQIVSDISRWGLSLKEVFLGTHDHKYKWDYIQFLQNVKGEYQEVFKRLLNLARDYKLGNERMLIVSTDKVDNLPKELESQFEVIKLELEKQGIPASTPKDTAKHQAQVTPKDIKEIYYDDREGNLFVDKIPAKLTPTEKVFFEYFWDHKSRNITVDEIIEHMTTFCESNNTTWGRRYFDKTLSSINCKGKTLGVKKLIRNVERGEYIISIKVKKKIFKP